MGYYIRVLGRTDVPLSIAALPVCRQAPAAELNEESSDQAGWSQLILRHTDGAEIAIVERNPVIPGELGPEEIGEFVDEVQEAQPFSASRWLVDYCHQLP